MIDDSDLILFFFFSQKPFTLKEPFKWIPTTLQFWTRMLHFCSTWTISIKPKNFSRKVLLLTPTNTFQNGCKWDNFWTERNRSNASKRAFHFCRWNCKNVKYYISTENIKYNLIFRMNYFFKSGRRGKTLHSTWDLNWILFHCRNLFNGWMVSTKHNLLHFSSFFFQFCWKCWIWMWTPSKRGVKIRTKQSRSSPNICEC